MRNPTSNEIKRQAQAFLQKNHLREANDLFVQVSRMAPQDMETWICLVQINAQLGRPLEVERCCREIIALWPGSVDAHYHLGCALLIQDKLDEAAAGFQHVLQINPDHAQAHLHLGKTFYLQEKYDEALACYRRASALAPGLASAHSLIALILQRRGDISGAVSCYRQALTLQPNDYRTHSDLIMALNYRSEYDADLTYAEHRRWGNTHKLAARPGQGHPNNRNPNRKLRIGYVSPNMYRHSVAFFFEPLLANHDPALVDIYCYAEEDKADDITKRLRGRARHWINTTGMSDVALIERIRSDRIDILVDLAGHTEGNRLLVFTAKPAPIQVTYLGYPNTTGIPAMDYRLTDNLADPPGVTDRFYTEELVRLPHGFLCYRPLEDMPEVTPLPAVTRGSVTFGSFNNFMKITPQVYSAWAAILHAAPEARLMLKNCAFSDTGTRQLCRRMFAAHGIDNERLELLGPVSLQTGHLATYSQVDIALNPFPYNGTTTTCEALWMGVPVVTLAGAAHVSRVGVSLLSQTGLSDLIAQTPDDYIRCAIDLAGDIPRLAELRHCLRERTANSSLFDEKGFAESVERAYRAMWAKWCAEGIATRA